MPDKLSKIIETGTYHAEFIASLINGLKKKGFSQDLSEKIAMTVSGSASCWLDGCKGSALTKEDVQSIIKFTK
ncbi:MAG: hypothetical protein WC358_08090 [Ignavibacteria bacterium]|jgi:hypothetical protein